MHKASNISIRKSVIAILSAGGASVVCLNLSTSLAYAIGWQISDEADSLGATRSAERYTSTGVILPIVQSLANWSLGLAITVFVVRVSLTALDRLAFTNQGANAGFRLSEIPFVGAYPDPTDLGSPVGEENAKAHATPSDGTKRRELWTWKRVWKRFLTQLTIATGSWLIIQILLGLLQALLGVTGA